MTPVRARRAVFPGSFNPPTVAHIAIAEAALAQGALDEIHAVVSRVALEKEHVTRPRLEHRVEVLRRVAVRYPWLHVMVTEEQLLADIARGYDAVILGADKWAQLQEPRFYGDSERERDSALARLPAVLIAARPPDPLPGEKTVRVLELPSWVGETSSTAARAGRRDLMVTEAAVFDDETGAWSDPARYDAWLMSALQT